MSFFQHLYGNDLSVTVSELLVATAESADPMIDGSVKELLRAVRDEFSMDVVFVSEIIDGERVFRYVDATSQAQDLLETGASNPVEESFCQRVIDGRLPGLIHDAAELPEGAAPMPAFRLGAHLSAPIVMADGQTLGTLCCFSHAPNSSLQERDLETLRNCAVLVARTLDYAKAAGIPDVEAAFAMTLPDSSLD